MAARQNRLVVRKFRHHVGGGGGAGRGDVGEEGVADAIHAVDEGAAAGVVGDAAGLLVHVVGVDRGEPGDVAEEDEFGDDGGEPVAGAGGEEVEGERHGDGGLVGGVAIVEKAEGLGEDCRDVVRALGRGGRAGGLGGGAPRRQAGGEEHEVLVGQLVGGGLDGGDGVAGGGGGDGVAGDVVVCAGGKNPPGGLKGLDGEAEDELAAHGLEAEDAGGGDVAPAVRRAGRGARSEVFADAGVRGVVGDEVLRVEVETALFLGVGGGGGGLGGRVLEET